MVYSNTSGRVKHSKSHLYFTEAVLVLNKISVAGETFYVDENGMLIEEPSQRDLRAVEFNFLDNKNICCGLCGEIVPYDLLMSEHLPSQHPEVSGSPVFAYLACRGQPISRSVYVSCFFFIIMF